MVIAFIVLVLTSVFVRDYAFIVEHPWLFILELVFFSLVPAMMIALVFVKTRHIKVKEGMKWLVALTLKFALFHILFQLSGVYTVLFTTPITDISQDLTLMLTSSK
jgi:hypothetical protein